MSTPVHLITVGGVLEKTKTLIETIIKELDTKYKIDHIANCETIASVKPVLKSLLIPLHVLIATSEWFEEEQEEIRETVQRIKSDLHLIMIPPGLQAQQGDKAVVEYLKEQIMESNIPKISGV